MKKKKSGGGSSPPPLTPQKKKQNHCPQIYFLIQIVMTGPEKGAIDFWAEQRSTAAHSRSSCGIPWVTSEGTNIYAQSSCCFSLDISSDLQCMAQCLQHDSMACQRHCRNDDICWYLGMCKLEMLESLDTIYRDSSQNITRCLPFSMYAWLFKSCTASVSFNIRI